MSFGGSLASGWTRAFHIVVNPADDNFLLGGWSNNITWGDATDGFIIRASDTGYIEWYITMSANLGYNDYVGGIAIQGSFVYALYYVTNSIQTNNYAFVKLTYAEGKKIWARRVIYREPSGL